MSEDAVREQLRRLGLSEAAVSVYLVVLRRGSAPVAEVADDAEISTRYAYDVADDLAERGLLTVAEHESPTTLRAEPPGEAIDAMVAALRETEADLESVYSEPEPQPTEFDLLASPRTARKRIRSLVAEAEVELVLAAPRRVLADLTGDLRRARERGVLVLALLADGRGARRRDATAPERAELRDCVSAARVWRGRIPAMAVADVRSGVTAPAGFLAGERGTSAVAVTQSELVGHVVGSFLSNYWPAAEEVAVGPAASLPRTYAHFRHAVFEAARQRRDGRDVAVTATVRPPEGGAETTLSGPVTEVRQAMLEPTNARFPVQASLAVDTGEGTVDVGGDGAFLEEYVAVETTLEPRD
jgi:sugar-specific transcriptional regulator TrmB